MEQDNLKQKVVKGTVWALFERFSNQIIMFVVGIVLARLLTPTDYGTVALLSLFLAIASVLADSGFGLALIQKKMLRNWILIQCFIVVLPFLARFT